MSIIPDFTQSQSVTAASVDAMIRAVTYGHDLPNVVCCCLTLHTGYRVIGFSNPNEGGFDLTQAKEDAYGNAWRRAYEMRLYEAYQAQFDQGL